MAIAECCRDSLKPPAAAALASLQSEVELGRAAALAIGFQQGLHQIDQLGGRIRLHPESDIEPLILRLGLAHSAQHDDRHGDLQGANLPHQFRAITTRHQVVGDDEAHPVTQHAQGGKSALGSGGDGNLEPCLPEDRLPNLELQRVIVDEEKWPQNYNNCTL